MIAQKPMASGSMAAIRLPNANTSSTRMIGTAIVSARARLLPTLVVTSLLTAESPPMLTSAWDACSRSGASRAALIVLSLRCVPTMSAYRPSVDRSAGLCVCQYESTCVTPGIAATSAVARSPTSATAGLSTVPDALCTNSTTLEAPPKCLSSWRVARAEPEFGSLNPPVLSLPNAVKPTAAPATNASNETARTVRQRRTTSEPMRPNMPANLPHACGQCQHLCPLAPEVVTNAHRQLVTSVMRRWPEAAQRNFRATC